MQTTLQQFPYSSRAQRTGDSAISWLMNKAIEDPQILSLAAGFVDTGTLPDDLLKAAVDKVLDNPATGKPSLQYGTTFGLMDLRRELAARLEGMGLSNVDPACICISNGGQQALHNITDVLVDPGDIVLVEDPTYFVYMDVLKAAGARVIGVATDDEGMIPESLEERLEEINQEGLRDRLKMLYVISYFSNPKGCNLPLERRRRIYEIFQREVERNGQFLLLEDGCYRDLALDGIDEPYIKTFDTENEHIFLTGTFSKAFAPGVRLGWSYMPAELVKHVARQKGNQDFGSSNFTQRVMLEILRSGSYDIAAARFRDRYRAKRDALIAALKEFWPADTHIVRPAGGLYVWAELPGVSTSPGSPLFEAALAEKVLYVPGTYCFCEETQGPRPDNTMRLCYGVIEIEPMREAVRRMGRAIAKLRG